MPPDEGFDVDVGERRWAYGDRHAFTLTELRHFREILPAGHSLIPRVEFAIVTREKQLDEVRKKYERAR